MAWDPENNIANKITNLKDIIQRRHQITVEVILHGKDNQQQFKDDFKKARLDVFSQTQFMRNVQTLDTKFQKAREELEAARKGAEEEKKRIDQLQAEYEKAVLASDAKAQSLGDQIKQLKEQDQQKMAALQDAYDSSARDAEGKTQLLAKEISDLKAQIANMPQPVHNHYHTDGGGDSGCVLL